MEAKITLSEAIENIREEIAQAIAKGADKSVKFLMNEIDLELGVEVGTKSSGAGKLDIFLARLSGETIHADSNVHRIKIKLMPVDEKGEPFVVSGQRQKPK